MSIYKTVFVTETENPAVSGEKIFSVSGDVALTTAFTSLDEAVSAVSSAAADAIIKVAGSQTESYVVISDGVVNSDVNVIAVDFDGGDVMIGGENLVIADSGIAGDDQASFIADLNDIAAGNGKVFVSVESAPADANTLFIGAGAAGTVVGADAAVIYGSNMDDFAAGVNSMYNSPVEAAAATEVAAGGNVYFDKNTSGSYVFKAGSVAHNELSKWDMTYSVTIEGGAKLVAGRNNAAAIAANTPQTSHIKSTLTLAGTADNKAVLNFLSDTRQDASLAILFNGKLVASHAEISVADLGFTGNATITDCTVYVDGVVAFGKNNWYKQTMTNTTMNVRGHNRHNENTYFSTEGVILNNLTMTNSSIKVDDSDDATTTEVVKIKKLTMASGSSVTTEGALEINGTITADSTCSLTANAVTFGTSGKIEFTLLEGFTSGKLIDITGDAGLAEDMLSKITLKGQEGFATIKEGDIYVYAGKAQADFDFSENDKNTLEGEVVAKTVELTNSKELAVTGEINAIDDANITNSKVEGAAEGVLNGGYDDNGKELAAKITAGNSIVMQNDGHANVELDAKNIVIANNSKETLVGNIGTAETENVVIAAGTATVDGVAVSGTVDGAIENAIITAGKIEIAGQEVADTELNGKVAITGDSEFKGAVKNDTVTKVTNGATLTIAEDAAFNGQFLAAGNDSYFGFGNSDTNPAGTIDIYGNVKVQQTNADANGVVNVKDGAVLNSPELCVENGGIADAESGVLNIENGGQVNTASMRVFAGGEVNVAGTLSGNQPDSPTGGSYVSINVWDKGSINVNQGGQILVDDSMNVGADGSLSVNGATLDVKGTLTNAGTVNVSGESTVNANVSGDGWIYMDNAALDADTKIKGAKVRFTNGTSTLDGATIDGKAFQVGLGGYKLADERENNTENVVVNVTNNSYIDADDVTYYGWVGSGYFDTDAEKAEAMTGAEYILNIDDSHAAFGYLHVSTDGVLNVTGNGEVKTNYGVDYSFRAGNLLVNGEVTFADNNKAHVTYTNVSCDNGTDDPGKLVIKDGAVYAVNGDQVPSNSSLKISKKGIVEVDKATLDVKGTAEITADATLNVKDGIVKAATMTNNGTVNVTGESTLNIASLSGNRLKITDGATITESNINLSKTDIELVSGTINFAGKNTISGGMLSAGYYNDEKDLTVNITGDFSASNLVAWGGPETKTVVNIGSKDAETTQYKGGQIGTFYGDTTLNVTNADVVYEYMFIQGNLNVSDSTLALNGHDTYFRTGSADHSIVIDNTTWTTGANTYLGAYGSTTSGGNAVVTVKGGSTINAGNLVLASTQGRNHVVSLTVDSSTINATTKFDVGAGTSVVLTDSTLSAGSIVNNGTISITVTDNMLDSIIDNVWILNQDSETAAALNLGVTINNTVYYVGDEFEYNNTKFAVTSGLNANDIVIERVVETAYVNEAWAGAEYGDKVAEGKFYLVNAFSSVSDALNNSDAAELVLESNITSDNFGTLKNVTLSTTVEGGVTINNTYDNWLYISGGAVIGENVTVNTPYAFMYGNGNKFDGKLNVAGQCYQRYDNVIEIGANGYVGCNGEAFIIRLNTENGGVGGFKITGNDALGADISTRDVQLYGNYFSFYSGTVDAKDTKIYGGQIDMTNTTDGIGKAVIKLDNSVWESDGHLQMTGNSSITLSNKSTLQINNIHGNRSSDSLDATSSITVDDSVLSSKALDNAGTITLTNGSKLNVTGTLKNTGTFAADNATITLGRFEQNGTTGAVFNNVDLNVGYFYNGAAGGAYAVIGGESKFNIADASGYFALRLADDAVLLDGTSVSNITMRAQGDVTFGKEATDFIHLDSLDTRDSYDFDKANSQTITVNGTLDIAAAGKGYSAYWMGIYGSENADDASVATTLTGNGVINSNTAAIFQYGKIVVDEGLTINVTDQYAADLRFTLTDLTIKGKVNTIGSNNKLNAIQTSTVTVTGENAALDIDSYLLVGYHTYKGSNDTVNTYKSTLNVNDGAKLAVDGMTYINLESQVNVNNATYDAADITNYGKINLAGADFSADMITGSRLGADDSAYFNIAASVDEEGNNVATKLNISEGFEQVIDVNRNSAAGDKVILTGNVKTSSTANSVIRTFNDVELSNFKEDAVDKAHLGKLFTDGNISIKDNSEVYVNWFQVKGNGVIEEGSTVSAPNVNIYDHVTLDNVVFAVDGTLKADTLIITNAYYSEYRPNVYPDGHNPDSVSNFIVGATGVIERATDSAAARFDLQLGQMTVYGYVNQNWNSTGGTGYIGNDGYSTTLTVDGTYAAEGNNAGKFINSGNQALEIFEESFLNVVNGGTFNWAAKVDNKGTITVDADSNFIVGSIVNTGKFNSSNAGEMLIDRAWNFAGSITSNDLTIVSGGSLTAGSINVTNLTLALGGSLKLASASVAASVTVTGALIPENAEYTLVTSGWQYLTDASGNELQIRYDANNDGTIDASELFTVGVKGAGNYVFEVVDNNGDKSLYLYKDGAKVAGLYIDANLPESGTVVADNGATYTIGVNAFHSIDEALASDAFQNDPNAAASVTSIYLGDGDHINDIAETFTNIKNIYVEKDANVIDNNAATFYNDVVIGNDGHLEADLTVYGKLSFTNTASDTLLGSYEADSIEGINTGAMAGSYTAIEDIVINNNSGTIGGAKGETSFTADYVAINGGDASMVNVEAGILELTNTNTFGLEADSDILSGSSDIWNPVGGGNILLNGSANMSIDGDNDAIGATIDSIDHTGTVTFNGEQTYTGDIAANKFVVAEDSDVKVNSTQFDFNELEVAGDLTVDFTASGAYTEAGAVTVSGTAGTINVAHSENWIINDTVSRDFSGFTGNITMTEAGAGIVMGKGDATAADVADAKRSYFADGSTVTAAAGQSLALAGNGITTGINFAGAGTINVGDVDAASALVDSASFTQTLTGTNTGFTGDVNVGEGATLNLNTQINAAAFNLDATGTEATGPVDATKLAINGAMTLAGNITGDANDVIDVNENTVLSGDNSAFLGDVNVTEAKSLTLEGAMGAATIDLGTDAEGATTLNLNSDALVLGSVITGDADDVINVQKNATLTADNSAFTGDVNVTEAQSLTLEGNMGAATIDLGTNADGATALNLNKADLVLGSAITGDADDMINVQKTATLSGNVSGFAGTYDIAAGTSVTLSGTIANVINAKGDTMNLTNAGTDVTVNAAANAALINLNFGANNVTLGAGDGDDFTNVNGSGNIVDFGADQNFDTVSADTIYVTGSEDALTIGTLTSDINITLDAMQSDDKADVTVSGVFTGEITVKVEDGNAVGKEYKLVKNSAFTDASSIIITVKKSDGAYSNEQALVVDQLVVIDGKAYLLQRKDETLVLSRMHGYSNFVVINGGWSTKVPYQAVMDGNIERIIGYDAAKDLADAVSYIKGYDTGINANAGTNIGDATMELLTGSYKLSTGTLMTNENGVTQLILKGRDGENVVISGTLRGSDGSAAADGSSTELVLENIRTTGYVFAGGDLTIKNSASIKTGGNAIAAGIANEDSTATVAMAQASKLTINGGYFNTNVLTGGSIAFGGDVTVTGSTTVVIDNKGSDTLTITGNIFGGSYAAQGNVTQSGDAYVFINAEKATTLRGNIYVSGFNSASGTLTMSGNSYVTFSGDASMLGFTGTVSAIQSAKDEIATFENFDGKFNGTLSGFDSIVISGSTELSFARRQTLTANTSMIFNINAATGGDAMYTVRDANAWEFAKTINVNVDNVGVGTYVLVAGYEGGFEDFTITLNGMATQNAIIGNYSYTVAESSTSGKLYLQVKDITNGLSTGAGVTNLDSVSIGSGSGDALTFGLGSEEVITSGNTTINGKVNAPYSQAEVFTVADGKTTVNGDFGLGNGNDKLDVQANAEMEINGDFTLGNGNNDVVIGADAKLTVNGDAMLGGGSAKNIVTLEKGAIMNVTDFSTGTTGSGSALIMDVDAILNNTEGYGNKPIIEVEGVASLTTDIAGAKALVNALDWSAAATNSSQYTIDDVEAVLGTATQIAGAGTAGDTTDDIWASLSKIDNQLVVAWGRSEVEVGAALDAFNAQTDLTFGQAVVATATSLGDSDTANDFSKKNHGTLA